jgi:hypothetical protein
MFPLERQARESCNFRCYVTVSIKLNFFLSSLLRKESMATVRILDAQYSSLCFAVRVAMKRVYASLWHEKAKLSLCLINWTLRQEGIWGSGCIDPLFLDFGTSWRWLINFTPRPLYPWGKSLQYPFDRRLVGPQNRSRLLGEEKTLDPTGTRNPTPQSSSSQPIAVPTTVSRLCIWHNVFSILFSWR